MVTRRDLIRTGALGVLLASSGGLLEACGGKDTPRTVSPSPVSAPARGLGPLDGFAARLYAEVATAPGNLVISPYSVAIALSMTLAGARGETAAQLAAALGADPVDDRWHEAMRSLTAYVDGLAGPVKRADGSRATIGLTTADTLFGQQGFAWQRPFLEVLARDYGAGMREVDFLADPDHVADLIDAWVAGRTDDRIKDLVPHGALTKDDRLVLVDAISLTAPWEMPFDRSTTRRGVFHRADGSTVHAPMMTKPDVDVSLVSGDGWRAARIPYAARTLAMTIVLPDEGRFAEVEAGLAGGGLTAALAKGRPASVVLTMPRWSSRTSVSLAKALESLGVSDAFDPRKADFSGMTTQDRLDIAAVLHQGWIKVDEDGTEAAAATAVVMGVTSGQVAPPTFTVDRPFLYVVHDTAHGTPLFLGRVSDPTA